MGDRLKGKAALVLGAGSVGEGVGNGRAITQARKSMAALLHLVKRGYSFRIKKRGRPDARLVPASIAPRTR